MTGLRRTLGLCVALATFQAPAWAGFLTVDEPQDTLNQVVEMLARGHRDEAQKAMAKLLAMDLDAKAAFALRNSVDERTWLDLLVEGGDFELGAKRITMLAASERKARLNDKDAILALVKEASTNSDASARRLAVRKLSANHGEYAVPYMLPLISEGGNDDVNVLTMHALAQMSTDVVVPLCAALKSDNAILRRNVTMVLGNIGDRRCVATLQWTAAKDSDETVKQAATAALAKVRAGGNAVTNFLQAGDAYYNRTDAVLRPNDWSDVVWDWKDGRLSGRTIPRSLYASEMSKRMYFHALAADPSSTQALAGLSRAYLDEKTRIDEMVAAGTDVGDWKDTPSEALMAVNAAGIEALDLALKWAVDANDSSTGAALCQVLAPLAKEPTTGLRAALKSNDGAISSEAAVALGTIGNPGAEAIGILGSAAGREIMHIAAVIDGDAVRGDAIAAALQSSGTYANRWASGIQALTVLRRTAAADVILVADTLPDLTTAQLISDLRSDERTAKTPILVITKDAEATLAAFTDRIQGAVTSAEDLKAVEAALGTEMTGDRARAEGLAVRASTVLAHLAHARHDITGAIAGLSAAAGRVDKIAIPALHALGSGGGAAQVATLVAVVADEKRSDDARSAAGLALATLVGRIPSALDADSMTKIQGVVGSSAALAVRQSAAQVLGNVPMSAAQRAELLAKLRG